MTNTAIILGYMQLNNLDPNKKEIKKKLTTEDIF